MQTAKQETIQVLETLATEQQNPASMGISSWSALQILTCINREDATVASRVAEALPSVAEAVELVAERMEKGGRLVYVGAGTSGRLGYMDAAECKPTYGCEGDAVACVMAGGHNAVFCAQEMLEDDADMASRDLIEWGLRPQDVVAAASASGRTPYCIGALDYAASIGAGTVSIACNLHSEMARHAQVAIEVDTGAEVVTGSTRMKAGTAQKMVMNMLSTAVMIRLGRTCDNLMVMIHARNVKASHRMLRLFAQIVGNPDLDYARDMLEAAGGDLSAAALMALYGVSREKALAALEIQGGHFKRAMAALDAEKAKYGNKR